MKKLRHVFAILAIALIPFVASAQEETAPARATPNLKSYNVGGALDFTGSASYTFNAPAGPAVIHFDELENDSTINTSGLVKIALIVTPTPVVAGQPFPSGWALAAQINLQPIPPGFHYTDFNGNAPLLPAPPDGPYYVNLFALEQEATNGSCWTGGPLNGYCIEDWFTFPTQRWVVGGQWQVLGYVPPAVTMTAVEYFHTVFGHFFVSADPAEIAALDAGAYGGVFTRTGQTWKIWTPSSPSGVPVCRFFTTPGTFGTRSSHFFTPDAAECNGLKLNPNWIYEGIVARVGVPSAGVCPFGTQILYRLYNQGQTGAPNHRYTTSLAIRNQMIALGFAPEDVNSACIPL